MFKNKLNLNKNSGMTFIELVVVMGIFTAISATVLFNYRSFTSGVSLQNISQEIALFGKSAQTLATQGRRPTLSQSQVQTQGILPAGDDEDGSWVSSYGIAFNLENNDKSFISYFNSPIFYDPDNFDPNETDFNTLNQTRNLFFHDFITGNYTSGCGSAQSECLQEIFMTGGSYIDLICVESEPRLDPDCENGYPASQLHISFTRPRLEAYILAFDGDTLPENNPNGYLATDASFVRISSQDGSQKRFVTFWPTGQISVN